jgi:hypothetical protein
MQPFQSGADQMRELQDGAGLKDKEFSFDRKQLDQLQKQMQEFSKDFPQHDFKFDRKEWKDWQFQMFMPKPQAPSFDEKMREEMKRQMDQLKRQMEEMQEMGFDHLA